MAKKRPPKKAIFSIHGFDANHIKQTEQYTKMIDAIYNGAVTDYAKLAERLNVDLSKPFSFKDYPSAKAKADELMSQLASNLKAVVTEGSRKEWLYANEKNDAFLESIFYTSKIKPSKLAKYQDRNLDALKTFQDRKTEGLNLSDRIWNYSGQMKSQMELAIDLAIGDGLSAQSLAKELKQYLVDPDKLFRRVRDKHGVLQLSKNAQAFNPGQGKYRSSHKNALRLARTEINMAYRESDHLRWKQLDFVDGFEVKLSNAHRIYDICDIVKGKYPKGFKFIGWHPSCMCYAVPILQDPKDFNTDELNELKAAINGTEYKQFQSANTVTDVPKGFKDWIADNTERAKGWKSQPYFVRDNFVGGNMTGGLRVAKTAAKAINNGIESKLSKLTAETKLELGDRPDRTIYRDFENTTTKETLTTEQLKDRFGDPIYLKNITKKATEFMPTDLQDNIRYLGKSVIEKDTASKAVEKISLDKLSFSQEFVFQKPIAASNQKAISVINYKGKNYVVDGNHSLARQILEGKTEISAKITYIDNEVNIVAKLANKKINPTVSNIPSELALGSDYLKGTNIEFKEEFFALLDKNKPVRLRFSKTDDSYQRGGNLVQIGTGQRSLRSKGFKERIIYHEYGHAIDDHRGLRYSEGIKNLMDKYKKTLSKKRAYSFRVQEYDYVLRDVKSVRKTANVSELAAVSNRLDNIHKKISRMPEASFTKRGITKHDIIENIGATMDTIMSLNPNYGWGHTKSYFKNYGMKEAEFIAHAFENTFVGNPVFKKYLPDLYDDMILYIKALK